MARTPGTVKLGYIAQTSSIRLTQAAAVGSGSTSNLRGRDAAWAEEYRTASISLRLPRHRYEHCPEDQRLAE